MQVLILVLFGGVSILLTLVWAEGPSTPKAVLSADQQLVALARRRSTPPRPRLSRHSQKVLI